MKTLQYNFLRSSLLLLTVLLWCSGNAQINVKLNWGQIVVDETFEHGHKNYIYLEDATYQLGLHSLPQIALQNSHAGNIRATKIEDFELETSPLTNDELQVVLPFSSEIGLKPDFKLTSQYVSGKTVVSIRFTPFIKESGVLKKIESIKLNYNRAGKSFGSRMAWKRNSGLASGTWYKVGIANSGMVKLDYAFFQRLGFNPAVTNLNALKVFTAQGGTLPENNTIDPIDDLTQIPVYTKGGEDEKIDKGDYAVFFIPGPHNWRLEDGQYLYTHNIYSDSSYFFISFNSSSIFPPITNQPTVAGGAIINEFDDYAVHELENSNLISSGRIWFGEHFNATTAYSIDFNFPNIIRTKDATIRVSSAIRSLNSNSTLTASAGSIGTGNFNGGSVSGNYTDRFAIYNSFSFSGKPAGTKISVFLNFSKANGESQAWLDKVQINCKRSLTFSGSQMAFRNISTFNQANNFSYELAGPRADMQIWNISNPVSPKNVQFSLSSGKARFNLAGGDTSEYIVFDPNSIVVPTNFTIVDNQDLHLRPLDPIDMVIISPKDFFGQAEELAELHRDLDDLTTIVVDIQQIYNEFSGGRQDLSAIKNYLRFLKETAASGKGPRYVLLFGDASFDFKNRVSGNTNYIPIYQTFESLSPTTSIATDDYIGYLSPDYNGSITSGIMEVGVGRFPVKTARQASDAVNKVRSYYSEASFGPWRNKLTFIADDEDRNRHMEQVDKLSTEVDTVFPRYNVVKVMSDAYPQRATPGGHRYPDVNTAIDDAVQRGSLTVNYLGHGGELGWAHERILEVSQINKWNNIKNMPLLITATCEFSRFDDPKRTSAGEFVFLNPDGGGIALLTTTRLVYSTPNFELAKKFNEVAYDDEDDEYPRLGDLARRTKASQFSVNSRVFALLGDPAVRLAYPQEKVVATSVPDTIRALDLVTITGEIRNRKTNELLEDFNGIVYPTVFDKEKNLKTLNNDRISQGAMAFKARTSVLFRGKASVKNGKFTFSFVVPKDIDYNYGFGKISFYAENGVIDANGFDMSVVVGGKNPNAAVDKLGPQINLFMNDSTFVNGGMTDENPTFYAKLFDQNGINTTGSGVGHDIAATIDANTLDQIVLNEYYETELNSYQKGIVNYPLSELNEGNHTLQLKAWDVYNNSSTADIAFIVSESEELALDHVLNYPNPFTTNTDFYLEHNHPNQDLFVRVQVFTISGKVVKTIDGTYNSKGFRLGPINWNGLDDFGDKIGKGVYVYKVYVKSPDGDIADKFEKLVILH